MDKIKEVNRVDIGVYIKNGYIAIETIADYRAGIFVYDEYSGVEEELKEDEDIKAIIKRYIEEGKEILFCVD